ncbi:5'-nucleotidase C-terminal domain-containing protein [bacterium]|nr:5'-nucleotidase C-terminal domain-containing protein [bacterium]
MNFNIPKFNINKPIVTFKSNQNKTFNNQPPKYQPIPNDSFEMSIGYVNDIHGQTNNMMRILTGIKGDLRLSAGDNDIGDEKNQGVRKATTTFLNIAGIKASALGNHELDTSQKDCIDAIDKFDGDFLSINYKKEPLETQDPDDIEKLGRADLDKHLKKSTIVEVKGEKIGLIGASPMDMFERLTHPNYYTDSYMDSLDETFAEIQEEIDKFRAQGINKIVLVSHLGNKRDKLAAKNLEGVDVIVGGHSHELLEDIKEGENLFYSKSGEPIIMTQAGRDGNYFGLLNLTFDKNGIITKAQNNIAETRFFYKNMINQHLFEQCLGKPEVVGYIKSAPPPPKTLIEENPHANFVADVMREETDSEIGIWQHGGVRSFFHEGILNSSEVKDMAPFLDYVVVANVTEKALVDMFKNAIECSYLSSAKKPGLLAVSGLNYTVDPKKGKLTEMNFIDKNGREIELDIDNPSETKTYKVVADEFLMSAGADYKVLATEEQYIAHLPFDKDFLVCQYLKKHNKPIVINHYGRIEFESDDD